MKSQLSRFITSSIAIAGTLAWVFAFSTTATGCGNDDKNSADDSVTGADGGDSSALSPGEGNGNGGSAWGNTDDDNISKDQTGSVDSDASVEESDGDTEESEDADVSQSDDESDASESDDDADASQSDDEDDDSQSDNNQDDSETGGGNGSTNVTAQCTQDDVSECPSNNIGGGAIPMEVCCTEDGVCGRSFSMGAGFTSDCIAVQFQDPLISEDCEQCASDNCESEYSNCYDNAACETLSDCLLTCTSLTECASCLTNNAAGLAAYGSLAVCAVGECGATCTDQFTQVLPPGLGTALGDAIAGGNFPGAFPGGFPGAFPGGFPGGFPGNFPGGFPSDFLDQFFPNGFPGGFVPGSGSQN